MSVFSAFALRWAGWASRRPVHAVHRFAAVPRFLNAEDLAEIDARDCHKRAALLLRPDGETRRLAAKPRVPRTILMQHHAWQRPARTLTPVRATLLRLLQLEPACPTLSPAAGPADSLAVFVVALPPAPERPLAHAQKLRRFNWLNSAASYRPKISKNFIIRTP
jgi:hypothetical protein